MTWRYAAHAHRLLGAHLTADEARRIGRRFLVGPLTYGAATLIAFVLPWLTLLLFLVVNVFYLWPGGAHEEALAQASTSGAGPER